MSAATDRQDQFLQLALRVARYDRLADVRVDLRPRQSRCRSVSFATWTLLAGITIRPATPPPGQARIELFVMGDRLDFGRYITGPGAFDLGHCCLALVSGETVSIGVVAKPVKCWPAARIMSNYPSYPLDKLLPVLKIDTTRTDTFF